MIKTEIYCDSCGKDLKNTSHSYEYFLALESRRKVHPPGMNTCFSWGINPSIDSDKHFCGLPCLKQWLNKENSTNE